jgi:hypothetical protein
MITLVKWGIIWWLVNFEIPYLWKEVIFNNFFEYMLKEKKMKSIKNDYDM